MAVVPAQTLAEVLSAFRCANGLDPRGASARWWTCRVGPLVVRLPNFKWRRDAILRHDLHHVLTGYPCTLRGEFQMAAWEFAAGPYPHAAATMFCLPLVAMGLLWSPRRMWTAFRRGRHTRSLYGIDLSEQMLASPVAEVSAAIRVHAANSPRRWPG